MKPTEKSDQLKRFISAVSQMAVGNQVAKGIYIQVHRNDLPGWFEDWGELRDAIPGLFGYPTLEEAKEQIEKLLAP